MTSSCIPLSLSSFRKNSQWKYEQNSMQMQSKVHGKLVKTDSQVVLLQALPRTHGQAIPCNCLYYYRLWYSFLSSLSHHEHVCLWPLVFISIISDLLSLFPCFVNKCLQAIDSSLDSSLQIWAKCSANMRKTQCQCNQNCIANMSKVQFKYEPNPIQIWAKPNTNTSKTQ